ncbi:hypothetical protein [Streptomonospora nanhaiensis]|uniref:hypothetical protein n=1 Tax=Streptomonospora nanhaiensis TaxID=1323731 RepID=UPI0020CAF8F0|nr:hypothetical protein [Streptomonospora nanhaiensis]
MLTRDRTVVVGGLALGFVAGGGSLAWADPDYFDGNAQCDALGCEAQAESGAHPSNARPDADGGATSAPGTGAVQAAPTCEETGLGTQECETLVGQEDLGDTAVITAASAIDAARDALRPPTPQITTSPSTGQPVLVHVPVWLWVEEDTWRPESARAEVPGGSVEVTATPTTAHWSMGDGTTVSCDGPGTPFVTGRHDPAAASPECGHTFTRPSTPEPEGVYDLEVAVVWEVEWSSAEGGGALEPLVTTAAAEVDVVESHGLVDRVP